MTLKNSKAERRDKGEFVERSNLYQEFLAERDEILRHKWLESEKAGHDIGFERALLDWIRNHRDAWRTGRRPAGNKA
jgi:hypothetical protein